MFLESWKSGFGDELFFLETDQVEVGEINDDFILVHKRGTFRVVYNVLKDPLLV